MIARRQPPWPGNLGDGGGACKLGKDQLARLGAALDAGPAACGWDCDQRWTLARVAALVTRLFGVDYTLRGVSYLLHRVGFTPQVAAHRAAERDEDAIAEWRSQTWAQVRTAARSGDYAVRRSASASSRSPKG
jgi:putative transposase